MSSMPSFTINRVGRSVMLALATATALVSFSTLAQDTAPAPTDEELERIRVNT